MEAPTGRPRLVAALSLCVVVSALVAVILQDFAGALPFGLFNEGRELLRIAAALCAIALGAAALLFATELWLGRGLPAAAGVRGLMVSLLLLELMVTGIDVWIISAPEGLRLAGPYREAVSAQQTRVFLKVPHEGSPLGLRSAEPNPRQPDGPRVLFLGDSYTEGSGRSAECNYPEVAGSVLRERLGEDITVMNAGVAGYGPEDSLALFDYLSEEGYRFDAVVLNLFLENDFTDNLPGTQRRVVAGINFRFPDSAFLRWLHPLNTRTFRYLLFLARASQMRLVADDAVRRDSPPPLAGAGATDDEVPRGDGPCHPPPEGKLGAGVRPLVERRLEANYRIDGAPPPMANLGEVLDTIATRAAERGIPLAVVIFPDRILADRELAERLGLPDPPSAYALDRLRDFVATRVDPAALIDTTLVLRGPSKHYRTSDTHLSDVGNVVAGRYVGAQLAELLSARSSTGARRWTAGPDSAE